MYNHIKGLHIDEYQGENEDNTRKLACEGTVKLNANAQEFVPRFKREQPAKEDAIVGNSNIGNTINDVQKPKTNLMLPWKGFPNKPQKPSRSPQVVLLNDVDYIVVPSTKRLKKPIDQLLVENVPTAPSKVHSNDPAPAANRIDHEERRREHERKVAVEALKLAEQRRMRDPVIAPTEVNENSKNVRPIINISRSPIKFTPEERIKVDRLRAAKRERIERILREMTNSKQAQVKKEQLKQKKPDNATNEPNKPNEPAKPNQHPEKTNEVPTVTKKRYIPTTKEWDEQCRAKHLAKMEAEKKNQMGVQDANPSPSAVPSNPLSVVNISPSGIIRLGDLRATAQPRCSPPAKQLDTEKRRGNLTHFRPLHNWTIRRNPQVPLKSLCNKDGKIVQRYSIEQLLLLEPKPEELEKPHVEKALLGLGFLYDSFRGST
ncbi:uncharacterized protein LOC6732584 [Drosophila simulans]|uniref:Uncharacterized protein n=1 Tax=Drosophila simulans TaxID=7240 RepID=A0A0J9R3J3_DROSI|nr:uncharacterized protein LOC6732584 [Drosophila simulans]KMY90648.1 uncharacterized protein Dsimw501_GD21884 [Drosophila simulans]